MVDKRNSMQEYVNKLINPILKEALKNTMGVSKDGDSVRLYWRPNNYRLLIPFNKLTFSNTIRKQPSFPVELKISNYGSKSIFKITKGETIVIDKDSVTLHYSLKDDRGKKLYNEINCNIQDFENLLKKGVESIKNKMFSRLKEIIRCYGGSADFDKADWLRHEDGNIGDEFCNSLPENRIIFANTFKKVYKDEIEFTGKKGEYPTGKLINYIDNQALERKSPEILEKIDLFNNALDKMTKQLELHLQVEKKQDINQDIMNRSLKKLDKTLNKIIGIKQRTLKEEYQRSLNDYGESR